MCIHGKICQGRDRFCGQRRKEEGRKEGKKEAEGDTQTEWRRFPMSRCMYALSRVVSLSLSLSLFFSLFLSLSISLSLSLSLLPTSSFDPFLEWIRSLFLNAQSCQRQTLDTWLVVDWSSQ
jgi:hypothetical protein